jgi:hypothetical protein
MLQILRHYNLGFAEYTFIIFAMFVVKLFLLFVCRQQQRIAVSERYRADDEGN